MSISAYGSNVNRIVKSEDHNGKSLFDSGKYAVDASSTWNQGDLIMFNTTAHALRRVAATGDAATFVGIADNQVTAGKLAGPYDGLTAVDAAQVSPQFVGPKFGVVASLVAKTSDAFNVGNKVFLVDGGNSQQVTVTDPSDGNYIGIYVGNGAIASATAGQQILVKLGSRYPQATGTGLNF